MSFLEGFIASLIGGAAAKTAQQNTDSQKPADAQKPMDAQKPTDVQKTIGKVCAIIGLLMFLFFWFVMMFGIK